MKFLFILMGSPDKANAVTNICDDPNSRVVIASSVDNACEIAREYYLRGDVDLIEMCGAFEEAGCKRVIEATDNKVAVGYVVHAPEQDEHFRKLFG